MSIYFLSKLTPKQKSAIIGGAIGLVLLPILLSSSNNLLSSSNKSSKTTQNLVSFSSPYRITLLSLLSLIIAALGVTIFLKLSILQVMRNHFDEITDFTWDQIYDHTLTWLRVPYLSNLRKDIDDPTLGNGIATPQDGQEWVEDAIKGLPTKITIGIILMLIAFVIHRFYSYTMTQQQLKHLSETLGDLQKIQSKQQKRFHCQLSAIHMLIRMQYVEKDCVRRESDSKLVQPEDPKSTEQAEQLEKCAEQLCRKKLRKSASSSLDEANEKKDAKQLYVYCKKLRQSPHGSILDEANLYEEIGIALDKFTNSITVEYLPRLNQQIHKSTEGGFLSCFRNTQEEQLFTEESTTEDVSSPSERIRGAADVGVAQVSPEYVYVTRSCSNLTRCTSPYYNSQLTEALKILKPYKRFLLKNTILKADLVNHSFELISENGISLGVNEKLKLFEEPTDCLEECLQDCLTKAQSVQQKLTDIHHRWIHDELIDR